MQLTALSLALTRMGLGGFAPSSLFLYGEQGVWYEPSLTNGTCFQDATGTTPVTAVEQPVGLMLDKSKGLVLGPELVTNGDFSAGTAGWTIANIGAGTADISGGVATLTGIDAANRGWIRSAVFATVVGKAYEVTWQVVSGSVSSQLFISGSSPAFDTFGASVVGVKRGVFVAGQASCYLNINVYGSGTVVFDNISVRELPGNHAFQTTTTSRPVLSARYNLLTKTEQFDDAAWVKAGASVTSNAAVAPNGTLTADKLVETDTTGSHQLFQSVTFTPSVDYVFSCYAKAAERTKIRLHWNGTSSAIVADVDLLTGAVLYGASVAVTDAGNGWWRITKTMQRAANNALCIALLDSSGGVSYQGDGYSGLYIWGASLTPDNQASLPYQRVNTATDYDADPAKFPVYLRFDGVDDWLQTNSIDFTATDAVTVFAGARNLGTTANGTLAENFAGGASFRIAAPRFGNDYGFSVFGTLPSNAVSSATYPAPNTAVLTGIGRLSTDTCVLRINGTQAASSTADQGTGNYGNNPLYIGRRGGTTLPFNGQIYSLIVRGAQTSDIQIAQTERWVAGKTGVTL